MLREKLKWRLKRPLLLLAALFALVGSAMAANFTPGSTIYVKITGSNWIDSSNPCDFRANFGGSNTVKFTGPDASGCYSVKVPTTGTYSSFDFERWKKDSNDTKWNYINNLSFASSTC